MPTTRPRYVITETDELAARLDRAALRWPHDAGSRKQLLLHLIEQGDRELDPEERARLERRRDAFARLRGAWTGLYTPDDLRELRDEWTR